MGFFLKSDNEAIDKAQLHFRTKFQQESVGGGLLQKLYERKLQKIGAKKLHREGIVMPIS